MSRTDLACYAVSAVLALSGLVHLGVLIVSGGDWTGPLSWRKPATFGLSFGLTLATITWVSGFVPLSPRHGDGCSRRSPSPASPRWS